MKIRLIVLALALVLLLTSCGGRLDPETLALAEESDIICLARIRHVDNAPNIYRVPGSGYCIFKCQVEADYLGNLTPWSSNLYVLLNGADLDMDAYRDKTKGIFQVFLFLKHDPEDAVYHVRGWGEFRVFVPAGKNAIRWGGILDGKGLRLQDALRAYGKQHPGEKITRGIYNW